MVKGVLFNVLDLISRLDHIKYIEGENVLILLADMITAINVNQFTTFSEDKLKYVQFIYLYFCHCSQNTEGLNKPRTAHIIQNILYSYARLWDLITKRLTKPLKIQIIRKKTYIFCTQVVVVYIFNQFKFVRYDALNGSHCVLSMQRN